MNFLNTYLLFLFQQIFLTIRAVFKLMKDECANQVPERVTGGIHIIRSPSI
jgi:hypothetical protein